MLHSFLSTLIGSRILSNKSDCFKLAQRKITLKVFYLGSAPVYSFPLNWFKKEFSLLLWPFSSFEAEDEDEKISRPHLGDLSLKLLITFLEISLIEKSLDFAFVVDGASLASLDDDDDVASSEAFLVFRRFFRQSFRRRRWRTFAVKLMSQFW